ncbi:hypothetical protein Bca52824_047572 [Brassica carinata]|uniref:Uncharacterized protein n=1 Tax=Brassica carinata TaxID=52824 RepID=A0A8X7RHD1_BRACI|nr:hypothetical protein Bca52824_047572 [Brassica carinata]
MSPHFKFDPPPCETKSHFPGHLHGYGLLHFSPFEYTGEGLSVGCTSHPGVRSREFLCQGHTAHATKEDADKEVFEALDHYHHIYEEYFAVPVVKGMKSEKKFAGACYTTSVSKLVVVYKVQRCLTSHSQIKKEKIKGIGVMILTYGDDKGLVNPPNVAPIQVRLSEEGNGLDVCDS